MNLNLEQKHVILGAGLLMLFGALAIGYDTFETSEDEIDVVATFYPMYDITGQVAGEEAQVSSLVPPGTDPHSFEPSPQDIERLNNADFFVVTGAEFEEWESDLVDSVEDDVRVVDPSRNIDLIKMNESDYGHGDEHHGDEGHHEEHHEGEHHEEHHEEEHGHDHGTYDPHYWLSPQNAQIIAEEVSEALQEEDEENAEVYQDNFEAFNSDLDELDSQYQDRLEQCEQDTILITHAAFSYLGQEYGFSQVPVTGLGHLTEPTAQELENLQDQARNHGLEYVFYDSMVDSSVAETIADEVDADVLELNSIEGAKEEPYIDLMEENLENLETALQCQ